MSELSAWVAHQARAEQRVVRLEDALLANSFTRYFVHRLRFLVARAAISTVIHAFKIVLLLGAFPRSEFVVIVIAQAVVALVGDFWWGALEQLRSDVRLMQRRGRRDLVPREIARWLSLAVRLALVPAVIGGVFMLDVALTGELGPVNVYVGVLLGAMAIDFVNRAYHSGAYALRRVYRPLPSLLALDVVSVGALLALWPFIGLWAFPIAELISVLVVFAIAMHYTTRTYRTLAIPTLIPLLRLRRAVPSAKQTRAALLPGMSYALVGLEALVVVAGVATATTAAGSSLVVLLAALGPLSRASFEWARLLYFDLKRLELALLADLRRRFDRAVVGLAVVMGLAGGALATVVAVFVLPRVTVFLLASLAALFLVRSVLAAAQMQAFTRTAYVRLAAAGLAGVVGLVAVFVATADAELRLLGVAGALGVSLLLLLALPAPVDPDELIVGPGEWLRRLRLSAGPVAVAQLRFDTRMNAPGHTAEARRAEAWRRDAVARRLAIRVSRRAGAAAWVNEHALWTFEPADQHSLDQGRLIGGSGGLLGGPPAVDTEVAPAEAALRLAGTALSQVTPTGLQTVPALLAQFRGSFPSGITYDTSAPVPPALSSMASEDRVEIYRAAVTFARDLRPGSPTDRRHVGDKWDATALVDEGTLRAVFAVPRTVAASKRRAWRQTLRAWNLRRAAGLPVAEAAADPHSTPVEAASRSEGPAML